MQPSPELGPTAAQQTLVTAHEAATSLALTATRITRMAAAGIVAVLLIFSLSVVGTAVALVHIDQTTTSTHNTVQAHNTLLVNTLGAACILIEHANPPLPVPAGCHDTTLKSAETASK